ncbi:hypothetical protein [Ruegeria sp. 6PALISEP08]|uniref:hypothetical protein n=1 Tax=Ruegeria sp. 6PALISEP08 TaxID=1225660 RepID=UPI000AFCAAB4|nr:hypothetical protein [Ruegeria sp. 6PALISEP08]
MKYATVKLTLNVEDEAGAVGRCNSGGSYICPGVVTCPGCFAPDESARYTCVGTSCAIRGDVFQIETKIKEEQLEKLTEELEKLLVKQLIG